MAVTDRTAPRRSWKGSYTSISHADGRDGVDETTSQVCRRSAPRGVGSAWFHETSLERGRSCGSDRQRAVGCDPNRSHPIHVPPFSWPFVTVSPPSVLQEPSSEGDGRARRVCPPFWFPAKFGGRTGNPRRTDRDLPGKLPSTVRTTGGSKYGYASTVPFGDRQIFSILEGIFPLHAANAPCT